MTKRSRSLPRRLARKWARRNRGRLAIRARMALASGLGKVRDRAAKRALKGGRYAMLREIPPGGRGVEVGVWKGDFSAALLEHLAPARLTLVDPWMMPEADVVVFPRSRSGEVIGVDAEPMTRQEDADRVYESVRQRFAARAEVDVVRATSLDAAARREDGSLDWVYIDGSHYYEDVRDDLAAWLPKLKPTGRLFGDDYYWRDPDGHYAVKRAVDEFVERVRPRAWVVYRGQFMIWL